MFAFIPLFLLGQEPGKISVEHDILPPPALATGFIAGDTIIQPDSIQLDSIQIDTTAIDSVAKPVIEDPIVYNAEDSIIISFDGQKVYMYNKASVTYQNIELTAYYIELNLQTKEIYAEGILDST